MKNTPPQPKYWTYDLGHGWTAMAGKTDIDNDLISFQVAHQTDYWFHLSGAPGSHVLLRGPEGEAPTRELLQAAASIAAYHSKARKGGWCHVDCCLAKDVSKPPHVPPGTVTIAHSRTLRARPQLPG
ncbi:MAG: DUF814 domain-containing protein [Victivallales bacterium]|nr:DUF814 domain-containing protein [Victivallales bacterium]